MELTTGFYIISILYAIMSMLTIAYIIFWDNRRGDISDLMIMAIQVLSVISIIGYGVYCYRYVKKPDCVSFHQFDDRDFIDNDFFTHHTYPPPTRNGTVTNFAAADIQTSSPGNHNLIKDHHHHLHHHGGPTRGFIETAGDRHPTVTTAV